MKLIDRYMNAVAFYLPAKRREDITRELRANILDRLESLSEERSRELTEEDVSTVLLEMGHPQQVAAGFMPPRQLVSADLFPLYKQALGYGLILVLVLQFIGICIAVLLSSSISPLGILAGLVHWGLIAFAAVTGVFYLLTNPPGGKPLFKPYSCWSPKDLLPVEYSWQRISGCEQSVQFFLGLLQLVAINYLLVLPTDLQARLPAFAEPILAWIPWISALVILSLLLNLWNLRYGFWTRKKLFIHGLLNTVNAVVFLALSSQAAIFAADPDSAHQVLASLNLGFKIGFLATGLLMLWEAGKDFYRIWLLARVYQ